MNSRLQSGCRTVVAIAALVIALGGNAPRVAAFPPAPNHVLFGQVRDELGNPLTATTGQITLETASGIKLTARIVPGLRPGVNYELSVPMDAGLTADPYKPTALRPTLAFRLTVTLGGTAYVPIEMRGDYSQLGAPAGRTRIDLTLGEDSDGDGLPDAWERALIAARGGKGTLADIGPNGDTDGDGLSNLNEYLAGTYAFDPKDGFTLSLVKDAGKEPALEFLGLRGRTYRMQASADLHDWHSVEFRLIAPVVETAWRDSYFETDVRVVRVTVAPADRSARFFRLMVE